MRTGSVVLGMALLMLAPIAGCSGPTPPSASSPAASPSTAPSAPAGPSSSAAALRSCAAMVAGEPAAATVDSVSAAIRAALDAERSVAASTSGPGTVGSGVTDEWNVIEQPAATTDSMYWESMVDDYHGLLTGLCELYQPDRSSVVWDAGIAVAGYAHATLPASAWHMLVVGMAR
jgi:hypothetical protein